jgi:hypothetical protein
MKLTKNAHMILQYVPTTALVHSGARAAAGAICRAKALGLNIHYIEDGLLIEEAPDGTRNVLKGVAQPTLPKSLT